MRSSAVFLGSVWQSFPMWMGLRWPRTPRGARCRTVASHLRVALECGGSDGYSGVTANPVVGVVADRLIDQGGAAVLSETTEIYGAEHLL
ncbi:MAG: hypothetical protein AAGD07_12640 [Planctomycetota bacterium]